MTFISCNKKILDLQSNKQLSSANYYSSYRVLSLRGVSNLAFTRQGKIERVAIHSNFNISLVIVVAWRFSEILNLNIFMLGKWKIFLNGYIFFRVIKYN